MNNTVSASPIQVEIEKHRDRIRSGPRSRDMRYLNLIKKAVPPKHRALFASEEQIKLTLGVELDTTLTYLSRFQRKSCSRHDISHLMNGIFEDVAAFGKMVDEYLEDEKKHAEITEVMIALLKDWIEKNQKHVPHELLVDLERDMWAANNNKWIQQQHVWEIWSDGEIITTKGGDLYGARSEFSFHPPLLHKFNMKLPRVRNELSYCTVETEEIAIGFRNRMKEIADSYAV